MEQKTNFSSRTVVVAHYNYILKPRSRSRPRSRSLLAENSLDFRDAPISNRKR
jgi:hypothetical protein